MVMPSASAIACISATSSLTRHRSGPDFHHQVHRAIGSFNTVLLTGNAWFQNRYLDIAGAKPKSGDHSLVHHFPRHCHRQQG
jgi:hypothetical protein